MMYILSHIVGVYFIIGVIMYIYNIRYELENNEVNTVRIEARTNRKAFTSCLEYVRIFLGRRDVKTISILSKEKKNGSL